MSVFTLPVRLFSALLMIAALTLSGCQTTPQKGLTPAQVAVLKQQGFELTDDGWEFGLSGKVLFGSDVESLNAASTEIVERIGKALLGAQVGDHFCQVFAGAGMVAARQQVGFA